MTTYKTKQGDTWDLVAYQQLGSCVYTDQLMWANRLLLDYYSFPAGIVLNLPDPVIAVPANSPPWKKVGK